MWLVFPESLKTAVNVVNLIRQEAAAVAATEVRFVCAATWQHGHEENQKSEFNFVCFPLR